MPTLAKYDIIGLEEEEVESMCNLHEFYIEQGKELGIEQGILEERTNTIKLLMSQLDKSFEEVYAFCKYDEDEIETYRQLIEQ